MTRTAFHGDSQVTTSAVARQPRTPGRGGTTIRRDPTIYIVLVS